MISNKEYAYHYLIIEYNPDENTARLWQDTAVREAIVSEARANQLESRDSTIPPLKQSRSALGPLRARPDTDERVS